MFTAFCTPCINSAMREFAHGFWYSFPKPPTQTFAWFIKSRTSRTSNTFRRNNLDMNQQVKLKSRRAYGILRRAFRSIRRGYRTLRRRFGSFERGVRDTYTRRNVPNQSETDCRGGVSGGMFRESRRLRSINRHLPAYWKALEFSFEQTQHQRFFRWGAASPEAKWRRVRP